MSSGTECTSSLTPSSTYAALVFDYATLASGAWTPPNLPAYLFINVAFLSVVWLFVLVCIRGLRGRLQR